MDEYLDDRQDDERILQFLKVLAENDREVGAPPGIEMRLRREFRRDRARRIWRRRALWSGAAVAAALVVTMAVPRSTKSGKNPAPQQLATSNQMQATAGQQSSAEQKPEIAKNIASDPLARRVEVTAPAIAFAGGIQAAPNTTERRPVPMPASPVAAAAGRSTAEETVTDFFPLLDHAPPFERGEILRVNLPASVMQTVGLPVREERLGDRIQADVLVGEEGLPRAIRFVRTDMR